MLIFGPPVPPVDEYLLLLLKDGLLFDLFDTDSTTAIGGAD